MRNTLLAAVAASALAATTLAAPAFAQSAAAPKFVSVPGTAVMSERLSDLNVYNAANEKVGEIEDVVIEGRQVTGYVLSVGGFLGVGDKYVVVSPESVAVSYNDSEKKWHARMDATKDQLKSAPEYKYDDKHKS